MNTLVQLILLSIHVMCESIYKSVKQQPKLCRPDTNLYTHGANVKASTLGEFQATQMWKRESKLRQNYFM